MSDLKAELEIAMTSRDGKVYVLKSMNRVSIWAKIRIALALYVVNLGLNLLPPQEALFEEIKKGSNNEGQNPQNS